MLGLKKWLIPIEVINLALGGLILAGLLFPKSKISAGPLGDEKVYQVLESYINAEMKKNRLPGLSLVIFNQRQIIYRKGFGNETAGANHQMDVKSLLETASLGKTGLLRSKTGDFRWQWGNTDGHYKMMVVGQDTKIGVITIINRKTGMKLAGRLAVKTMNEYWGTDLNPGVFDFM